MPGQLVHTNEVLVLLGDNWFAERSAKQAAEIVDRRMNSKTISSVKVFQDLHCFSCRFYNSLSPCIAADNFCKQFGPRPVRQNVRPDLDPICLTLRWYSERIFLKG